MRLPGITPILEKLQAKSKILLPLSFIVVSMATAVFYMEARATMIVQNTWLYIIDSNITLNFVLFLFLWGVVSDKATKGKSIKVQWTVFGVGTLAIILFFKFVGGFPTIIG